ncbi:hypothetical protein [Roseibium aggregatum]|uniref:hypothetical protein n=1 Tax=Roseibium aggregatum TaxID=187304 RepID=UPI003A96DDA8
MTIQTLVKHGLLIEGQLIRDTPQLKLDLSDLAGDEHKETIQGRLADEIIVTSAAQTQPLEFPSLKHFWENLLFRIGAVASMTALTSGVYDCDYYDPATGPEARLGSTDSARVSRYWAFETPGGTDADWQQVVTEEALAAILPQNGHALPFRGECAGAFQLTVFWGLLNGLGSERFSEIASQFGTMLVGPWTDNPATEFMAEKASLQDPPIPGDYMYFKNKDDYLEWAPDGFWQGLNAMYMGQDMLGTRHYSGMGASWLSEQNLRASLVNAYYHDCYPHIVACPQSEVRFTIRRLLQIPSTITKQALPLQSAHPSRGTVPTITALKAGGYQAVARDTYENQRTTVNECATLFGITALDLHQQQSSGLENPASRFEAPGATIVLTYHDPEAGRRDPDAVVRVIVKLKPGLTAG